VPARRAFRGGLATPERDFFAEFQAGSEREVSTTMAFVQMLRQVMRIRAGARVVPIVPDEARTFGMESLFRQHGIYSSVGQLYEPVDSGTLLLYRESKNGQILEEGITRPARCARSTAAGTSYSNHGLPMVPFFIYYSMFGFQRIGDLIWAFGDQRGAASCSAPPPPDDPERRGLQARGRPLAAARLGVPNLVAYDPAYAYEVATILQDGCAGWCARARMSSTT